MDFDHHTAMVPMVNIYVTDFEHHTAMVSMVNL